MSLGMHPAEKAKKNQLVHLQWQNKRRIRQVGFELNAMFLLNLLSLRK